MTHYQERLQRDLDEIMRRVAALGRRVEKAARNAVTALLEHDRGLAARIVLDDHPINRETREIDALCHVFVARHLPSAGVLRTISSVMRLTVAIERVGDYAVTIGRETAQLSADVPATVAADVRLVADTSLSFFASAMDAWNGHSADAARAARRPTASRRSTSHQVFHDLVAVAVDGAPSPADLFALLLCLNRLERIGDQAKNICEETVFAVTGETKQPKTYSVLFVDRANDAASVMAEAIARRTFPESGRYASAGREPAAAILPDVVKFLERTGHRPAEKPRRFDSSYSALEAIHVVVGIDCDVSAHIPELPFHTTVLRWDVTPPSEVAAEMQGEAWLAHMHHELAARIADLMQTLRGSQAR